MFRACLLGFALLVVPSLALATERQHHLGLSPTVSVMRIDSFGTSVGAGLAASYTYGLTDQFNLMAEVSHSFMGLGRTLVRSESSFDPPFNNRPSFLTSASVGAAYVLDVLRWVPYGGVMISGNMLGGGSIPSAFITPGADLVVGLDYQATRHFVVGAGYKQHFLFAKLPDYPFFGSGFVKLEYQWGF